MPSEGPDWPVGAKICPYKREFRAALRRIADIPDCWWSSHIQRYQSLGCVRLRSTRQVAVELAIKFHLSKGVCLFGGAQGCDVRGDQRSYVTCYQVADPESIHRQPHIADSYPALW